MNDLDAVIAGVLGLKPMCLPNGTLWCHGDGTEENPSRQSGFEDAISQDWNALMAAVKVLEETTEWGFERDGDGVWQKIYDIRKTSLFWFVDEAESLALAKCIQAVVESE